MKNISIDNDTGLITELLSDGFSEEFVRASPILPPLASIETGLKKIGILSAQEQLLGYADRAGWHRAGAETFVSIFEAKTIMEHSQRHYHIIAKAIVKWGVSAEKVIIDWTKRQQRLTEFGVSTPYNFANWNGIVFQQFIPFSLTDYLQINSPQKVSKMIRDLIDIALKVDQAGFHPVSLVEDLRTDGSTIFLVDLGEDLGHFSLGPTESVATIRTVDWIKKNCTLDAEVLKCLGEVQ